jgi:hypothetical protein
VTRLTSLFTVATARSYHSAKAIPRSSSSIRITSTHPVSLLSLDSSIHVHSTATISFSSPSDRSHSKSASFRPKAAETSEINTEKHLTQQRTHATHPDRYPIITHTYATRHTSVPKCHHHRGLQATSTHSSPQQRFNASSERKPSQRGGVLTYAMVSCSDTHGDCVECAE